MAYNITVLDKQGDFATVMVAPEQEAIITKERCITNHQKQVTWPEQASFSKTIERKKYLDELLKDKSLNKSELIESFLKNPLRSDNYAQQFGTVFTAVYQPEQGTLAYHWPDQESLKVNFDGFIEQDKTVNLGEQASKLTTSVINHDHISDYSSDCKSHNPDYVSEYQYASYSIPMEIRESLLMGLEYLPCDSSNKESSIKRLRQLLKLDKNLSWIEYGNSITAII
ncbi:MAG: hypothetical protein ACI88H_000513 [Cocleimonas sp.]|jgi:hypothetical protein